MSNEIISTNNNKKTKIIAEIGWNHLGNISLAKKMVRAARLNGAHICKFQFWSEKKLKKGPWDYDGRRKIYKKSELSIEKIIKLKNFCNENKIKFLTSVFNKDDAIKLKKINLKVIKIPSHECTNNELIDYSLKNFKEVILSIGACTKKEFHKITKKYKNKKNLIVMHCVSSYPLKEENVNFPKLYKIKKIFNNFGYSSHYPTIDDCYAPIFLGAKYIEKHFTIDNNLPGRDNKFAITPKELKKITNYINLNQKFHIDSGLDLQKCEKEIFLVYRDRWNA